MELLVRFLLSILNLIAILIEPIIVWWNGEDRQQIPPIGNPLLNLSLSELITRMRQGKVKSQEIVEAYVERVKEVNPFLNAVIEDRFQEAINDAKRADKMLEEAKSLDEIFERYPLLGVPFTVKESCGLKGMSHVVGNIHRKGYKSVENGPAVENLMQCGGIPILVSANPEFCMAWETNTLVSGKCKNPFDTRRSAGGSSGGEGALNGAGASLFGVGSDIAGSIRLPALYNGVFGHKPTGHLVDIKGHFPNNPDKEMSQYLQIGPITRFARDLPFLTTIMAGEKSINLDLQTNVDTKNIKIYYMDTNGFTFTHKPVDFDIRLSILKAVNFFKKNGVQTEEAKLQQIGNALEIGMFTLLTLKNVPSIMEDPKGDDDEMKNGYKELLRHVYGKPKYSFCSLVVELLMNAKAIIPDSHIEHWDKCREDLKSEMLEMLGEDGVLFFPTFHRPAVYHNTSVQNLSGVGFLALVNSIGFPATHIPMGLNDDGIPIGFQVIAAPHKDKLCFQIAAELENAFGGWRPPYSI